MEVVSFRRMDEGTPEDYLLLDKREQAFIKSLPERLLNALAGLRNTLAGYRIDRLQHSLQAATRAEEDGADIELIVAALVHDLGDDLAPVNHAQLAAAIIRPYVRTEVSWIVEHHGVFQMYYYGTAKGLNKDERERHRGHKWFASCERFCARWDQVAFDPDYPTQPLNHFAPMVREVFSRTPFDPAIIGEAA